MLLRGSNSDSVMYAVTAIGRLSLREGNRKGISTGST
jgi:hypothetical protein